MFFYLIIINFIEFKKSMNLWDLCNIFAYCYFYLLILVYIYNENVDLFMNLLRRI